MNRKLTVCVLSALGVLVLMLVLSGARKHRKATGASVSVTNSDGRITLAPQNDRVTMTVVADLPKPAPNAAISTQSDKQK